MRHHALDGLQALGHIRVHRQLDGEHTLVAATEQRQRPVAGDLGPGLGIIEIVGELGARLLLAVDDLGDDHALGGQILAQAADQFGVFGEALHQDLACAIQRVLHRGHALFLADKGGSFRFRHLARIGEQRIGQRLQPRLSGNLRLGAALLLERQIKIFQHRLGVGLRDLQRQLVRQLALLINRPHDGGAPVFHLAQIDQPLFQLAQLGVIQPAGRFLAVARDEGHRRTLIQHLHRGIDLVRLTADLLRNPPRNPERHFGGDLRLLAGGGRRGKAGGLGAQVGKIGHGVVPSQIDRIAPAFRSPARERGR